MDPIETLRGRLEECEAAILRERYLVASGQKDAAEGAAILERFADVADPSHPERIRKARTESPDGSLAARLAHLERRATRAAVRFDLRVLSTKIDTFNLRRRIEWNGESLTLPHARARIGTLADARERLALHRRLVAVEQEVMQHRLAKRWQTIRSLRERAGLDLSGFARMWGIDFTALADAARAILSATEAAWRGAYGDSLHEATGLHPESAATWDHAFWAVRPDATAFDLDTASSAAGRTARALGLSSDAEGAIHVDSEARPLKENGVSCWPLAVGRDVRIASQATGAPGDGPAFLRAFGQALHFGSTDPEGDAEDRFAGDLSVNEALGFLFRNLSFLPSWRRENLPAACGETPSRRQTLSHLYDLRRCAAKVIFESRLHAQDDILGLDLFYRETMESALGIRHAKEFFLQDLEDDFHAAVVLRGWLLEAGLADQLEKRWGETWWRSREAGAALRESYVLGASESAEGFAERWGIAFPNTGVVVQRARHLLDP